MREKQYSHRNDKFDRYIGKTVVVHLWNDKIIKGTLSYNETYGKYEILQNSGNMYKIRKTNIIDIVPYM